MIIIYELFHFSSYIFRNYDVISQSIIDKFVQLAPATCSPRKSIFNSWRAIAVVGESGFHGINNGKFAVDSRSSQVRKAHSFNR